MPMGQGLNMAYSKDHSHIQYCKVSAADYVAVTKRQKDSARGAVMADMDTPITDKDGMIVLKWRKGDPDPLPGIRKQLIDRAAVRASRKV